MAAIEPFLRGSYLRATARWDVRQVTSASNLSAPGDALHGAYNWLLTGDIHLLWARWFAEGIVDPDRYSVVSNPFPLVLERVLEHMPRIMPQHTDPQREQFALSITELIVDEIARLADAPGRRSWLLSEKRELWDASGLNPRCWICGYLFSVDASRRFLGQKSPLDGLPTWVDFMRPRGLAKYDLRVEVDHVGALGAGGDEEELRLSCGWCNRHKRNYSLLYDAPGAMRGFLHPKIGRVSIPNSFWIVRALAMQQSCQYEAGCTESTESAELTVAAIRETGAPNPANLQVVCTSHDPLSGSRFVDRSTYSERLVR
jgi:hypothetical protein